MTTYINDQLYPESSLVFSILPLASHLEHAGISTMASLLHSPAVPSLLSLLVPITIKSHSHHSFLHVMSPRSFAAVGARFLTITFAVPKPNTSNYLGEEEPLLPLLQELSGCLDLPSDYLSKLPRDLRLDLNDAAFDLSNGPVFDECGQEIGEILVTLSRAWEQADTMTSNSIALKLPSLHDYFTNDVKSAIGKRLLLAGKRFEAMGQYGQGELLRIAKSMIKIGELLSKSPAPAFDKRPKRETASLKFGELQVELTPQKAYIGAAIAFAFGFLSWELSQGIQSIPETSFLPGNDNSTNLAKSLRGFLIAISYSATVLSASALVGLILLGRKLGSENRSNDP